jgi:hypothetical protein
MNGSGRFQSPFNGGGDESLPYPSRKILWPFEIPPYLPLEKGGDFNFPLYQRGRKGDFREGAEHLGYFVNFFKS